MFADDPDSQLEGLNASKLQPSLVSAKSTLVSSELNTRDWDATIAISFLGLIQFSAGKKAIIMVYKVSFDAMAATLTRLATFHLSILILAYISLTTSFSNCTLETRHSLDS